MNRSVPIGVGAIDPPGTGMPTGQAADGLAAESHEWLRRCSAAELRVWSRQNTGEPYTVVTSSIFARFSRLKASNARFTCMCSRR